MKTTTTMSHKTIGCITDHAKDRAPSNPQFAKPIYPIEGGVCNISTNSWFSHVALVGFVAFLAASPAFGQTITSVSPATAAQGATNVLVTFTLGSSPPPPPIATLPTSVTIGTNTGSALARTGFYTVTAVFNISASETVGSKNATVVFPALPGTFTGTAVFQVTAGSGVAAGFAATPTSGTAPLAVSFTDASTGTIASRLWDFGDGTTSTANNPSHTYTSTGGFTVTLTVTGTNGSNTLTRTSYVIVSGTATPGGYTIADTGQTTCYDNTTAITAPTADQAFYGQDAQCSGNQPSYTRSDDGLTVHDNTTGLTWPSTPDSNGDGSCTSSDKMVYASAQARPAVLNAAHYGGFSDWRLPTIKEMYSLMDFRGTEPTSNDTSSATPFINTSYFQFAYGDLSVSERVVDSRWVTTNVDVASTNWVFGVNFADGRIKHYSIPEFPPPNTDNNRFYVLCVRGKPSYSLNLFVDNGDLTITDRATGLMWTKGDSGSGLNWSDALAWVQTKNATHYLGHNDWRLPNAKELQSIVDYSRSPETTASAAIDPIFTCTPITNENNQADYPWYWTGTTHANDVGTATYAVYVCFGRAMGYQNGAWNNVHGAGCQRSDPKSGTLASYTYAAPNGYYNSQAPQGDAIRIFNYVRPVRDAAPVAGFSATPTSGGAPLAVAFTDTSTGSITNRHWNFGDGSSFDTTTTNLSHSYSLPGAYTVSLTASGPGGSDTKSLPSLMTVTSVDSVGDGIPDWWRAQYFGGNGSTVTTDSAATDDSDHDGVDNLHEYLADTTPTAALSCFHIRSVAKAAGFSVSFQSSASRSYTLYFAADLTSGAWAPVPGQTHIAGSGGVDSLTDPAPTGERLFYRVGVQVP